MTFGLKPSIPIITYGEFAGVPAADWPPWYLQRMHDLARDGRLRDNDLADHIKDVYRKAKENEGK